MNKIFKVIFNRHLNQMVVTSELARGVTRAKSEKVQSAVKATLTLVAALVLGVVSVSAEAVVQDTSTGKNIALSGPDGTAAKIGEAFGAAVAIGDNANAQTDGSIALGNNAKAGLASFAPANFAEIENPKTKAKFTSEDEFLQYIEKAPAHDPLKRQYQAHKNNIAMGVGAEAAGSRIISIGEDAGKGVSDNWNLQNVNVGTSAGAGNKQDYSVSIGFQAGFLEKEETKKLQSENTHILPNVNIGKGAGKETVAYGNVSLGNSAGSYIKDPLNGENVFLGESAGARSKTRAVKQEGKNWLDENGGFANPGGPQIAGNNVGIGTHAFMEGKGDGNTAIGRYAMQMANGGSNTAVGENALLIVQGSGNTAVGALAGDWTKSSKATSIGFAAHAYGDSSIAMGNNAFAGSNEENEPHTILNDISIGSHARANGGASTAIGKRAQASSESAMAMGANAQATAVGSIAIGGATGMNTSLVPNDATGNGLGDTQDGDIPEVTKQPIAEGAYSIAMGTAAHAIGPNDVVIGKEAKTVVATTNGKGTKGNATAVGYQATASGYHSVSVGVSAGVGTTGYFNFAFGSEAGQNLAGEENISIGRWAGKGAEGNANINIGLSTGEGLKVGPKAGSTPGHNINIGDNAGKALTGSRNVYVGENTGRGTTGTHNVGLSVDAVRGVKGDYNVGIGERAGFYGDGSNNVALGWYANNAWNLTEDGVQIKLRNAANNVVAVGNKSLANKDSAVAIGDESRAYGLQSIAIGKNAHAYGENSVSVGVGNYVHGDNAGAFGDPNKVYAKNSYALGNDNTIGKEAEKNADAVGMHALGNNIAANVDNSVYLGNKSRATAGSAVGTKVKDSDGADGTTTTAGDTGTVASATIGKGQSAVTYDGFAGSTAKGVVTVGAAGAERRIQNVAAGEISTTSTDAINGSQLYAVAKFAADNVMHYFSVNSTGGGNYDNKGATGKNAVAIGQNVQATASRALGVGNGVTADGEDATVLGNAGANAKGKKSIAIGSAARALEENAVALGSGARATKKHTVVIGNGVSYAENGIAIGKGAYIEDMGNSKEGIAIGTNAKALDGTPRRSIPGGVSGIAIGKDTYAHQSTVDIGMKSVRNEEKGANRRGVTSIGADSYAAC
ncbi:ESPR-type extended signal peptide-containing protein [Spirabiliibacterium falconis]|uniref:ESPR-type extended signal peptide-containing protein n=1 Tax=Spirabiliibacterium falconis TaxID=572023 RepID=UPI001AAD2D36|nr:ESPR-type extended signal peptide-containing protein [Spirabiliibacterium falconis]MBE2893969.1 hypothetical protein [Spirabiliibacterium falconis]